MGCFESDLQEFRIRQEREASFSLGRWTCPVHSARLGEAVTVTCGRKEVETQLKGTERRGVGRAAWTPRSFSDPDPHPCPQAVLVFLGFSEPLPTPYKMLLFSCIA